MLNEVLNAKDISILIHMESKRMEQYLRHVKYIVKNSDLVYQQLVKIKASQKIMLYQLALIYEK
jgi:hypothetical protein